MNADPLPTRLDEVRAALWKCLSEIEDPEVPVSIVDMGLIVALDYDAPTRTATIRLTFTAMGCPAMEMIQDDIRATLLRSPAVDEVQINVVWDPVWTPERLSRSARQTMKSLGVAV